MTIQGAIEELQTLFNAKDVPIYYKGAIKKVIETIQMDTVPKDFHDKTCEAMAKRHTEEMQKLMPKRGEWIHHEPFDKMVRNCEPCRECSCCHTWYQYDGIPRLNFCPNCGCAMTKESE